MTKTQHIAVLMGGLSSEREVSLTSGAAVVEALHELGYNQVSEVDVDRDIGQKLAELKPDIVFNALHGTYGEDGCIQGLLEVMGIPYTHSGVLASSTAMDKPTAKRLFEDVGVRCAPGKTVTKEEVLAGDVMERPYVIKPFDEGSSVGVVIVQEGDNLAPDKLEHVGDKVLVEKFIPGAELSVAVLDNEALGVIEIRPQEGFYDYESKYTKGASEYIMPAPISEEIYNEAMEMSAKAHQTLGCRGVTRADLRYDNTEGGSGEVVMLEVNTHPGMTPLSLVPKIAHYRGISFNELIETLVSSAQCDHG